MKFSPALLVGILLCGIVGTTQHRYDWGSGFHNYLHGRAIFPDSLRWLWRDYPGLDKS